MADKLFLDANIIPDFFLKRNRYNDCVKLFDLIHQRKASAFVTPSIIRITAHWLTKAYGNTSCKKLLQALLQEIRVVDSNHSVIEKAIESRVADVEDAIQYFTSVHHKADYFITHDLKLQKQEYQILPIVSLEQYLQKHQQ